MSSHLVWNIICGVLLLVVVSVFLWILRRRHNQALFRRLGIPGPPPDLIWGNWMHLKKDRITVLDSWIEKYGKVFGIYLAEKPYLVVTDADIVQECFVKQADVFQDRPQFTLDLEPFSSSLVLLKGQAWRRVRTVMNGCFTTGKIRLLSRIVNGCADKLLEVLREHHQRDEAVNIVQVAQGFAMDTITRSALAWQVNCQEDSDDVLLAGARSVLNDLDKTAIESTLALPGMRTLLKCLYPFTNVAKILDSIAKDVRRTIYQRKRGPSFREDDMLQLMLDAQSDTNDSSHRGGPLVEDRHIVANSILLLVAGLDSTAAALSFTLYLLAMHPAEQDKVHSEIRELLYPHKDAPLDIESLHNLQHLDMVIRESLRLYPPVPMTGSRLCARDTTVRGLFIPRGVTVLAPTWHIQRDPQHWPEPERFWPERFAAAERTGRHPAVFMPFGLGARTCLAKRLAYFELKAALCRILMSYRVVPCQDTPRSIRPVVPNIVLKSDVTLRLKLRSRNT